MVFFFTFAPMQVGLKSTNYAFDYYFFYGFPVKGAGGI